MTRSRLLIQANRQRQQRRVSRVGQRLTTHGSTAARHLAQQLQQHGALGGTQPVV
jgi:hypothetical protein